MRDHYVARFTDLSVVRVKDISKLSGARGEPRIIEALKAGSVTISSDNGFGLNARTTGFELKDVNGTSTNDRSRMFSIEVRDMFIAIHVATPELVASQERELKLSKDLKSARIDDFLLLISREKCADAKHPCRPSIGVAKQNSFGQLSSPESPEIGVDFTARLQLPIPISDSQGGLFESLLIRWVAACSERASDDCRKEPRLFARYAGSRLADVQPVVPGSW